MNTIRTDINIHLLRSVIIAVCSCLISATPASARDHEISFSECDWQPQIHRSYPKSRYKILNNQQEVKDLMTGLIWQRCALGQAWDTEKNTCSNKVPTLNWQQALQQAHALGNGYRLPTVKELYSLLERNCSATIDSIAFPNTSYSGAYWSSTPVATTTTRQADNSTATQAYAVYFDEQTYAGSNINNTYSHTYIDQLDTRVSDRNVARAVRSE